MAKVSILHLKANKAITSRSWISIGQISTIALIKQVREMKFISGPKFNQAKKKHLNKEKFYIQITKCF